jgi:hypothetical protein
MTRVSMTVVATGRERHLHSDSIIMFGMSKPMIHALIEMASIMRRLSVQRGVVSSLYCSIPDTLEAR